jgi:hypothetical protein
MPEQGSVAHHPRLPTTTHHLLQFIEPPYGALQGDIRHMTSTFSPEIFASMIAGQLSRPATFRHRRRLRQGDRNRPIGHVVLCRSVGLCLLIDRFADKAVDRAAPCRLCVKAQGLDDAPKIAKFRTIHAI